jgi:3-dehydroquinate synthase
LKNISVDITTQPKQYEISIGFDYLKEIFDEIHRENRNKKIGIITDRCVRKLWEGPLKMVLDDFSGSSFWIDFPEGEGSKTRKIKEEIENQLFALKFGRDDILVALGGGVVGDLAGFIASTYMRGLKIYHIPTTLLAAADSSIGGKTGVDTEFGKNLIGSFYHPQKVFIDTKFLTTLDQRNFVNGLIEVIKHGAIWDEFFFSTLHENLEEIINRDPQLYNGLIQEILHRNCTIKKEVIMKDPAESHLRKILNFGHTIGHGIELLSNFTMLHGEAVAIGLHCEGYIGVQLGITEEKSFKNLEEIILRLKIPFDIFNKITPDQMLSAMSLDKKSRNGILEFVLLEKIGKVHRDISIGLMGDQILALLKNYLEYLKAREEDFHWNSKH